MRLVRVTVPRGKGQEIARIAFDVGIEAVSIHPVEQHKAGSNPSAKEAVDIHVNTPDSKAVVDAVVKAPFYDRNEYSIDVREPRSILKSTSIRDITRPVAAPMIDIDQELWQFSHVTYSFVVRVLIASILLSYGMVHDNPLLMIGGLMFLPFMPLVLGVAFGALGRQWSLVGQSLAAFVTATLLICAGGAAVAMFAEPPIMFDQFPPLAAGLALSAVVGVAGAIATADDAGHRQLVGLAAASQLALIPAWLGISLVFGFPDNPGEKLVSFGGNFVALLLGAGAVYLFLSQRGHVAHGAEAGRGEYKV